jgi:hypothetical protein
MPNLTYEPRTIKRRRRTKDDMTAIRGAIYCALAKDNPMTVRQVFYRMVSEGVVEKTEGEYKSTVGRLLLEMRRSGAIPYDWVADNTRWMRKSASYSTMESALRVTARTYRRALWDNQDVYVEVWTEKDAIAGVLLDVTDRWDVPLMVTRGFSSDTYLYEAAESIKDKDKPAYLYYFGDHDPSGVMIDRTVERGLRRHAPHAEIHFERVAVRREQIEEWGLPTRPTKKTDSRSKTFEGESVEIDAIPPNQLRQLVEHCIDQHVDRMQLSVLLAAEESEREILHRLCGASGHEVL